MKALEVEEAGMKRLLEEDREALSRLSSTLPANLQQMEKNLQSMQQRIAALQQRMDTLPRK